jgi:hypothetical protein
MPIRAENRSRYPRNWKEISLSIRRDRAAGRCEWVGDDGLRCQAVDGTPHPITGSRVVLTVAHLDHQPENCAPENLRAWCQMHHNRYDMAERRKGIRQRARAQMAAGDLLDGRGA